MPSYHKLLFVVLFLGSCKPTRSEAIGGTDTLILFCDSTLSPIITASLHKTWFMPRAETAFDVQHQTMDQFTVYRHFRYLLFAGSLDAHDAVSKWIRSTLSPDDEKAVREGQLWILEKESPWAQGQMIWVLCTPDYETMVRRCATEGIMLHRRLEEKRREQETVMMQHDYFDAMPVQSADADTFYLYDGFSQQPAPMSKTFFWYRSTERFQEWILFSTFTGDSVNISTSLGRHTQKLLNALPDSLKYRDDFITSDTLYTTSGPLLRMCTVWTTKNRTNTFGGPLWLYVSLTPTNKPKKIGVAMAFGPQNERKHPAMRRLENLIIYNLTRSYE